MKLNQYTIETYNLETTSELAEAVTNQLTVYHGIILPKQLSI